jgi:glycosyltransferase involved in cell wall biosynthesis
VYNQPINIEYLVPNGLNLEFVELTIVVPALNEEITIQEFIKWCHIGINSAGVKAQILIVDSSTDSTPSIALGMGAEVLRVPKRGLGRAYIDSIPYIRGKWIIMGDADLTYDFRNIIPFIESFKAGADFIMGSRFRGCIEPGAMPKLHRYFGTPLTTWILNMLYGSSYTDIHCGMRGITRIGLNILDIKSQSWEYASEMVLKAARLGLSVSEVPVSFYKDREGRLSHHLRSGWMSPWKAGWLNLKVMLVYSPDSFLLKPGATLVVVGLLLSVGLAFGPLVIGRIKLNLYWMLLGVTFTTLGYSSLQIGVIAQIMHGLRKDVSNKFKYLISYNRGILVSLSLVILGVVLVAPLVKNYITNSFILQGISLSAVFGLLLIIIGFQTFCFTLLLEMSSRIISRE